jgi:hypothetical protein
MKLEGSCQCGAVRFHVESREPYPFNLCYCSICRKIGGSGGFGINIRAEAATLVVEGAEHIKVHHARMRDATGKVIRQSSAERRFCGECGSPLWLFHPEWPDGVYPYAGAIDTRLPEPPERTHLMRGSKAPWVAEPRGPADRAYEQYPEESVVGWHERLGLRGRA